MDLFLNDEQTLLVETVDRYFAAQHSPRPARDFANGDDDAMGAFPALGELGLLGILVPEELGGGGRGVFELALVAEVLGYHCAPGPFLEHVLATAAIAWGGSADQQTRWLSALASGAARATFANTGDDRFEHVLHPRGADVLVAPVGDGLALFDPATARATVELVSGFDLTRKVGTVSAPTWAPDPLDDGGALAARVRDAALVLLAADAVGGARRCVDLTAAYVKEREQFGVSIAHFQGVKHQFADMAVEVEPSRYLVWAAARAQDDRSPDSMRLAAIAKAHACDRFVASSRTAVELHGGIGYTWECDLHLYLRRAVFDRAYLGAPSEHRRRAAELAGWTAAEQSA